MNQFQSNSFPLLDFIHIPALWLRFSNQDLLTAASGIRCSFCELHLSYEACGIKTLLYYIVTSEYHGDQSMG